MDEQENNASSPVQIETPSAGDKPVSRKNLLIAIFLILVILGVMAVYLLPNTKNPSNKSQTPNQQSPASQSGAVKLETQYQNPLEKKTQYTNPFSQYKNPFDNIK